MLLPPKLELVQLERLYCPERFMGNDDLDKAIARKTELIRDGLDCLSGTTSTPTMLACVDGKRGRHNRA
jgi:hypothetical protein